MLNNNLKTLYEIFNGRYFRIPNYQRGYSWEKEQIIDLWNDLINILNSNSEIQHFMSFISYKVISNKDEKKEFLQNEQDFTGNFDIVSLSDGQQRITTLIILINELLIYFKNDPIDDINGYSNEEIKNKFLYRDINGRKVYYFGYTVDNPSYLYFKQTVLEVEDIDPELRQTLYTKKLLQAKLLFKKLIEELGEKEDGKNKLKKIYSIIVNNLKFIENPLEGINENLAFEVMNNRGKKLSNLEILKNRLLYICDCFTKESEKCTDEFELENIQKETKNKIIDSYITIYRNLGAGNITLDDDDFLKDHWILYFGKYKKRTSSDYKKDLFDNYFAITKNYYNVNSIGEIEKYEEPDIDDTLSINEEEGIQKGLIQYHTSKFICNYVDSLQKSSSYWAQLHCVDIQILANWKKDDNKILCTLVKMINVSKFRPLIIASYMSEESKNDVEKREKLYNAIIGYLFIIYYMNSTNAAKNESYIYQIANKLYNNEFTKEKKNVDTIIDELQSLQKEALLDEKYIDVDNFINSFSMKKMGGFFEHWYTQLKFVLYEYEQNKYDKAGGSQIISWQDFVKSTKDRISIEHIYPQTPDSEKDLNAKVYWEEKFNDCDEEQKNKCLNSLGNLLLFSQSINSSLQNASFDYKKKNSYGNNNMVPSHSAMEVSKYTEWNKYTILHRGLKIVDFMSEKFNIQFANESDKYKFLCLDFIEKNRFEGYVSDKNLDKTI